MMFLRWLIGLVILTVGEGHARKPNIIEQDLEIELATPKDYNKSSTLVHVITPQEKEAQPKEKTSKGAASSSLKKNPVERRLSTTGLTKIGAGQSSGTFHSVAINRLHPLLPQGVLPQETPEEHSDQEDEEHPID